MDRKVVMVLCDGLGDAPARDRMGYLEHLVEELAATRYVSRAVLPTNSRPNYESLHTGVAPREHGKTSNYISSPSELPNVFTAAVASGLTTAVVGLSWLSELYHSSPYEPMLHGEFNDGDGGVTYGRFYSDFRQPDAEVLMRGGLLARRFAPNYLLVHTMAVDYAGHAHGRGSSEYNRAISDLDALLAQVVPVWLQLGYSVLVTADHGHDEDRYHGGTTDDVRNVPMYALPVSGRGSGVRSEMLSQLQVAPTVCSALGIEPPPTMQAKPFDW